MVPDVVVIDWEVDDFNGHTWGTDEYLVTKYEAFDEYGGPYEVVPSEDEQVLATENTLAVENVVVRPIPSNYGRIAWDGTGIMVY